MLLRNRSGFCHRMFSFSEKRVVSLICLMRKVNHGSKAVSWEEARKFWVWLPYGRSTYILRASADSGAGNRASESCCRRRDRRHGPLSAQSGGHHSQPRAAVLTKAWRQAAAGTHRKGHEHAKARTHALAYICTASRANIHKPVPAPACTRTRSAQVTSCRAKSQCHVSQL